MPDPITTHRFTVWTDGKPAEFDTLEVALRAWNVSTFDRPPTAGGVSIQSFQSGLMVRDGWLLHVHDDGQVFINPRLTLA